MISDELRTEGSISSVCRGIRELGLLFFPIAIVSFSSCFASFLEQLLFARLSTQMMEVALNVNYVSRIFEGFCVALALMAQVFVGRWHGAQEWGRIGSGIWQFIWFSVFSMVFTIPANLIYGICFFKGTSIEAVAMPYFYAIISLGFFYPLGITLSCFFLGRGKTRLVVLATLISQILNLVLDYFLILGWKEVIPSMGLMGKAVSTAIAQGGLCLFLFFTFIRPKHAEVFGTRQWRFQPKLFWECIHPGLLRGVARLLLFASWASTAHLMTAKGGNYIVVLSAGGTLFLFLSFLGDALCQSVATRVSHILGAQKDYLLTTLFYSGSVFVLITMAILTIPLLLTPSFTFHLLFPDILLDKQTIQRILFGIWLSIGLLTYGFVPVGYVLAFKDTKFSVLMAAVGWINGYLLMYLAIQVFGMQADYFWIVLGLMHLSNFCFLIWRMVWLNNAQVLHLVKKF